MTSERIDIICRNLNVLSEINEGDKLVTVGDMIELDKWSPVQFLTRWAWGQGSKINLDIVQQNIKEAEDLIYLLLQSENQNVTQKCKDGGILSLASRLKNNQTIYRLRSSIDAALKGLERLLQSYKDQPACRSRILNLIHKGKSSLETLDKLLQSIKNE